MNVKDIINGMADRAFAYSFLQGVNDLYRSRDYGDTEPDRIIRLALTGSWRFSRTTRKRR